jgi:hypothetical protein
MQTAGGPDALVGFKAPKVDLLLGKFIDDEYEPPEEIPEPQPVAVSQAGDEWELHEHVLRWDATSEQDMIASRSRATWATDTPRSRTSFTASSLNSRANRLRFPITYLRFHHDT